MLQIDCKNMAVTDDMNYGFDDIEKLGEVEETHINYACQDIIDELKDEKNIPLIENKLYLQRKYF
jgi:hypothetical protein